VKKEIKEKIKKIIRNSFKDLLKILPIFFIAIIISVIAELNIPDDIIQSILGKNLITSILVATTAGIIYTTAAHIWVQFLHL